MTNLNAQPIQNLLRLNYTLLLCMTLLFWSTMTMAQNTSPNHKPETVKQELQEILTRKEFQEEPANSLLTDWNRRLNKAWKDFWKRVEKFLKEIFRESPNQRNNASNPFSAIPSQVLSSSFTIILIVVGVVLLAYLVHKFILNFHKIFPKRTKKKHDAPLTEEEELEILVVDPDPWIQKASTLASDGDYRRAFRAVFIATLLTLDKRGAIRFERGLTNGDYLRELRKRNLLSLLERLNPFTHEFDSRWYGHTSTTRADYERACSHHKTILSEFEGAPKPTTSALKGAT